MPSRNRNRHEITRVVTDPYGDPRVAEIDERMEAVRGELAGLERDADVGEDTHGGARDALVNEWDGLERERQSLVRQAKLDRIRTAAADPSNRESGDAGSVPQGDPVRRADVWRTDQPWKGISPDDYRDGGALVSRAHQALDAIDDHFVSHDAKERLAECFDDPRERGQAAGLMLALSSPSYMSAFRAMMMDPMHGDRLWGGDERAAWAGASYASRAATIGTGSFGWALPLQLDPTITLTNTGATNVFRQLATVKVTTSNTWNGVASTGATASWLGEGTEAADATPTLTQIQITPKKGAAWIVGSFETFGSSGIDGDVSFADQVPRLFADAKDRLESDSFMNAAGTGAYPNGFLASLFATGSDATVTATGTRASTDLYGLLEAIPPRFRAAGSGLAWLSSLTWLDKYRQCPVFTSAYTSIVDDSGAEPRAAGVRWLECAAMTTGSAATARVVAVGAWSTVFLADRWPSHVLYEPLVKGTASGFPTGQSGWFLTFRSNIGLSAGTGAFKVLRLT